MNERPIPSALRELRNDLSNRKVWIALFVVGAVLGISGPFETYKYLSILPSLLYWTVIVIVTYCIGSLIYSVVMQATRGWVIATQLIACAILTGVCVTVFLLFLNFVAFGHIPRGNSDLLLQFLSVTTISGIVVVGSHFTQAKEADSSAPPLLLRLSFENRGALIALSVTDHYVNVMTTKGSEMVLLRLTDAMREVGDDRGLQVHRSHWVAADQISSVRRDRDRAILTMSNDAEIPVSRSFMPAIREFGLLPRAANG